MRIWVDTADLDEIREWAAHPWVSGFTTNPTLMRGSYPEHLTAMDWATEVVGAAKGKSISIDGPAEVLGLGVNVIRKTVDKPGLGLRRPINFTAVCSPNQLRKATFNSDDIISVFAGRIMDTGRNPQPVIDAARATGAQVLWASVREPYNIVQAEATGCDIVTVPPAILTKWFDWQGLPLETVAARTIAQFDKDREGLW